MGLKEQFGRLTTPWKVIFVAAFFVSQFNFSGGIALMIMTLTLGTTKDEAVAAAKRSS